MDERIDYLDALRGFLMCLGVVTHSARVYDTEKAWLFTDANASSSLFDYIWHGLHSFRMEVFFIIAGYFCWMMINRWDIKQFAEKRLQRLAIPLLTAFLSLNFLQFVFLYSIGQIETLHKGVIMDYVTKGYWVSHTWFLIDLLIYHLLMIFAVASIPKLTQKVHSITHSRLGLSITLSLLLISPILQSALFKLAPALDTKIFNVITIHSLIGFFPYFLLGCVIYARHSLLSLFEDHLKTYSAMAAVCVLVHLAPQSWQEANLLSKIGFKLVNTLSPVIYFGALASLFKIVLGKPNKTAKHLSDASYSIYIFHHILVIIIGFTLSFTPINVYVKFALLTTSVTALCIALHVWVIRPTPALRWLFNGNAGKKHNKPSHHDLSLQTSK